jgi:hypothetical protein
MSEARDHDTEHHADYFKFMIGQLNEAIRYSDGKHTLGLTLIVSFLIASNEFVFSKIDRNLPEVRFILNLNVASALASVAFGYLGIFPKFIATWSIRRKARAKPNIFYFQEIHRAGVEGLRQALEEAFPGSKLSKAYQEHCLTDVYALSEIVVRKFFLFRLFLYALFFFLTSLAWLFLTTVFTLYSLHGDADGAAGLAVAAFLHH